MLKKLAVVLGICLLSTLAYAGPPYWQIRVDPLSQQGTGYMAVYMYISTGGPGGTLLGYIDNRTGAADFKTLFRNGVPVTTVWNSTHVISVVFGSTDTTTGLIFSSATVDIPVPYDMTVKAWCIDSNSIPAISGSCTISVSSRTWGGTYGVIDGGVATTNTKRPNMVSQTSSSGTTAGWTATYVEQGGCLKATVLTSALVKQITVGLYIWKPEP